MDAVYSSTTTDGRAGVRAAWAGIRRPGGWTGLVDGVPSVCVCQPPPHPAPRALARPYPPAAAGRRDGGPVAVQETASAH